MRCCLFFFLISSSVQSFLFPTSKSFEFHVFLILLLCIGNRQSWVRGSELVTETQGREPLLKNMGQKLYIFLPWGLKIYPPHQYVLLFAILKHSRYNFIFNWYLWKTLQFLIGTYFRVVSISKHRLYIPSI